MTENAENLLLASTHASRIDLSVETFLGKVKHDCFGSTSRSIATIKPNVLAYVADERGTAAIVSYTE